MSTTHAPSSAGPRARARAAARSADPDRAGNWTIAAALALFLAAMLAHIGG